MVVGEMRYKCTPCHLIVNKEDLVDNSCPVCHSKDGLKEMCEYDHICTCKDDVQEGIKFCQECQKPICKCGSHDVFGLSRVTGYYQDTAGWNKAKRSELKQRQRYEIT